MSYIRPMGDGPITDPSQVDGSIIVGEVPPTRVDCSQLPADSPFRAAGQPCAGAPAPASSGNFLWDIIAPFVADGGNPAPVVQAAGLDSSTLLLLAGAGVAAYYMFGKKKR